MEHQENMPNTGPEHSHPDYTEPNMPMNMSPDHMEPNKPPMNMSPDHMESNKPPMNMSPGHMGPNMPPMNMSPVDMGPNMPPMHMGSGHMGPNMPYMNTDCSCSNMPPMGMGAPPNMSPMEMAPEQYHHKQHMHQLCHDNMHQKVQVQTVKGHQFNALIDHVDAENVYFILVDDDAGKGNSRVAGYGGYHGYGHGGYGYGGYPGYGYGGYGGGIGRLILPLAFLAGISSIGGWGY